ncbi:hypothetical protein [Clostridium ljungdahlii]|uniref:Uncharacterized protein n=1 Tax=Clostridium ljungdahlii TaxID=1538 RepID=A0A166RT72_9CLOT|nr:hypothetical protein [Clostridium ljungdahlii]OAA91094.1 hypothetical protein WY13_00924 [Clostridium ljungdahlii]
MIFIYYSLDYIIKNRQYKEDAARILKEFENIRKNQREERKDYEK